MRIKTNFYTLTPYQNFLHIESFLSWDEQVVSNFVSDLKNLILQRYHDKPWAILNDGREWAVSTPQAERLVVELVTSKLTGTITHHAFITGPSAITNWQAENIFKDVTTYSANIFEDWQEAIDWLSAAGYDMSPLSESAVESL